MASLQTFLKDSREKSNADALINDETHALNLIEEFQRLNEEITNLIHHARHLRVIATMECAELGMIYEPEIGELMAAELQELGGEGSD